MPQNPVLAFCPYLPLRSPVEFGGWWLGPLEAFPGPWLSEDFRQSSLDFLGGFYGPDDRPISSPTVLARLGVGMDGSAPTPAEQRALLHAIHYTALDGNPIWSREEGNRGWSMLTSDNSDLFFWRIDVANGYIATTRGSLLQRRNLGPNFREEDFRIDPPAELPGPLGPVSLDPDVLRGCFQTFMNPPAISGQDYPRRLETAAEWYGKSFRNSDSITWEDRTVMLKVAFEALTGHSKTWSAARWVRDLFERVVPAGAHLRDHLWSRAEAPRHHHSFVDDSGTRVEVVLTDLEDWFRAFGRARNQVLHMGRARTLEYRKRQSRYSGPIFHTGERLFREAFRTALTECGHPDLWMTRSSRMSRRAWAAARQRVEEE